MNDGKKNGGLHVICVLERNDKNVIVKWAIMKIHVWAKNVTFIFSWATIYKP